MAKRSLRHPPQYEANQAGCIWGLISIFDFRHGRFTRKLISDRRRGTRHAVGAGYSNSKVDVLTNFEEKCQSIEDGEESVTATANAMKTSVKQLVEEEMFDEEGGKKQLSRPDLEPIPPDSEHGIRSSSQQLNDAGKKSCDTHYRDLNTDRNLGSEDSCHPVAQQKTSNNLDQETIMEELCHQIHQKSTSYVKKHDWHDGLDIQSNNLGCTVFEEKLSTAIKVIIEQSSTTEDHLTEDGEVNHSKEFVDALQMLSSNKELFLKLVEDPKSPFVKHIQDSEVSRLDEVQNSNSLAPNMLKEDLSSSGKDGRVDRKRRNFFRRKSKSQGNILMKGNETSQPASRIVILKPGPPGFRNSDIRINSAASLHSRFTMENKVQAEKNASHFSFTEFKRKLKHAMGKERHWVSRDRATNLRDSKKGVGAESGGWSSPNRNHFYAEKFAKPLIGIKRRDKSGDFGASDVSEIAAHSRHEVSKFYIEAKKHLSEILSNGDENAELMIRQLPKTLGRVLSLPEYNSSPTTSPGKDGQNGCVTAQKRLSPCSNFEVVNENKCQLLQDNHAIDQSPSKQNDESKSCVPDDNTGEKIPSLETVPDLPNELNQDNSDDHTISFTRHDISSEGISDIMETTDAGHQENSQILEVSPEPSSSIIIRDVQEFDTTELCHEERSPQCSKMDSFKKEEISSPSDSPSSSSVTRKIEDPESATDKTERPSPVSVLEPLYVEDDISPASTTARPVESVIQPLQIRFEEGLSSISDQRICISSCMEDEESAFEYIEAVLLSSGLTWDEFLLRWLSTNEVLDPSLFDEVELFSNRSSDDQKLLFDCTQNVLREMCEHYFSYFPRLSSVKHKVWPIPTGINLIHEVWEGVEWNLLQNSSPHSLDQLIRKEMAKSRRWPDLQSELEHTGVEIGEAILEELLEETILHFRSESGRGVSIAP